MENKKVIINNHTNDFMMTTCVIRQLEDTIRYIKDIEYFATDKLLVDMAEYASEDLHKILNQLDGYLDDNYEFEH